MNHVYPIRNPRDISAMKRDLLAQPAHGKRDHLMFTLGINVGLRIGDILALTWRDLLDLETMRPRDHYASVVEEKTDKANTFVLGENVQKAIKLYLATFNGAPDPDDYVFASRKGANKPITERQALRILSESAQRVGIKDAIGTHSLRKTFGYHMYKRTNDLGLVQSLLNHSSSSHTLRYIGITQERKDDAMRALNL